MNPDQRHCFKPFEDAKVLNFLKRLLKAGERTIAVVVDGDEISIGPVAVGDGPNLRALMDECLPDAVLVLFMPMELFGPMGGGDRA